MVIQPIRFGDEGQAATRELLRRFDALAGGADPQLRAQLATLERLDRQYGGTAPIELEDVEELVANIVTALAALDDPDLVIGAALWAQRHDVAVRPGRPGGDARPPRPNRSRGEEAHRPGVRVAHGAIPPMW